MWSSWRTSIPTWSWSSRIRTSSCRRLAIKSATPGLLTRTSIRNFPGLTRFRRLRHLRLRCQCRQRLDNPQKRHRQRHHWTVFLKRANPCQWRENPRRAMSVQKLCQIRIPRPSKQQWQKKSCKLSIANPSPVMQRHRQKPGRTPPVVRRIPRHQRLWVRVAKTRKRSRRQPKPRRKKKSNPTSSSTAGHKTSRKSRQTTSTTTRTQPSWNRLISISRQKKVRVKFLVLD